MGRIGWFDTVLRNRLTAARALLLDNLDAAISVVTGRLTAARAANLDKLLENVPYTTGVMAVYPTGALPTVVTSAASAWGWGSWTEIVPVNTITTAFLIVAVGCFEDTGTAANRELQYGQGASGAEAALFTGKHTLASLQNVLIPVQPFRHVAANTRIAARVRTESASALAVRTSLHYVPLPL